MSKRNSSVCKWKANEKCVTVLHPLQCISIPHRGHPEDTRGKKKEINTTSISHSILWLSDCSNRKTSARQEVTCTYLHHTTPLFFLSPTLLSFQRQATHGPDRTHEAAAEHCHLPDTGDNKSQPRGYIGSHADAQPSPCLSTEAPTALDTFSRPTLVQQQKVTVWIQLSFSNWTRVKLHLCPSRSVYLYQDFARGMFTSSFTRCCVRY